jgi:hypothetical protein
VGNKVERSSEDDAFIRAAKNGKFPVVYRKECDKTGKSKSRYLKYMMAETLLEALSMGATSSDVNWDYERGFIRFSGHEPAFPGHVFHSRSVDHDYGIVHTTAVASLGTRSASASFADTIASLFEPSDFHESFMDPLVAERFSEMVFGKVLGAVYNVGSKIDWSKDPEPRTFDQAMKMEDADLWYAACTEEMDSMVAMNVLEKVPIDQANIRQLLHNMWVLKRKRDKNGLVCRYRARVVAQGNRQRPGDSYNPDETTSPTVGKASLHTMLAMCAQLGLRVYQADVKTAFLQAPLKEEIYMRAPRGFEEKTDAGVEIVYRLKKAIYGLKQAAACFWTELSDHLVSKGYKAVTGDVCVLTKPMPDGSKIVLCTYVDDITFGVTSQANADLFMTEMRERFIIDEGEGKPIEWLLGIAIDQDLGAGTKNEYGVSHQGTCRKCADP